MNFKLYSFLIFSSAVLSNTAMATEVTFDNLKTLIKKQNLNVEANSLDIKAAEAQEGRLLRSFIPQIEVFSAQESFKEGSKADQSQPTHGAEAKINFFNGGRNLYEGRIQETQTNIKRFKYQISFTEELRTAREVFWKYIYAQESIGLINEMIEVNNKNLKSAQQRIIAGVATQSDRYEFELKAIELKQLHKETVLSSENLKRQIKLLLNFSSTDDFKIVGSLNHDHDYEIALKHKPSDHDFLYKEYELGSEVEKLKSDVSKSEFWPKLDLYASYKQRNQLEIDMPNASDRIERVAGIKLTINLNEGYENYRQAKASLFEAESLVKRAQFQKREVELHVESEISELDLLHSQVHDSDLSVKIADKYFKATLSEYARGVKNSPDVLGASDKLFETKNKRLEIIRDFQLSKSHILSKIGQ
jgi:outer membrane protein